MIKIRMDCRLVLSEARMTNGKDSVGRQSGWALGMRFQIEKEFQNYKLLIN